MSYADNCWQAKAYFYKLLFAFHVLNLFVVVYGFILTSK